MRKFFSSISPTAWLLSATILAATALVCLTFKDYDRYHFFAENSRVFDKRTGVLYGFGSPYSTDKEHTTALDYPASTRIIRPKKEVHQ